MKSAPDSNSFWLHNGEYCEGDRGILSAAEIGVLNGVGVFETIPLYHGTPFALEEHWQRLVKGANRFDLPHPSLESLEKNLAELAKRNGAGSLPLCRARITLLSAQSSDRSSHEVLEIGAPPSHPSAAQTVTLPYSRNERGALSGIKSINYGENAIALLEARRLGADEALFANTRSQLCEGIWTNVFVKLGQRWCTPPLSSGCLPGVTRKFVFKIAPEIEEADIEMDQVETIEAAFLTSSMRGIQPVSRINDREIPSPLDQDIVRWKETFEKLVTETL